MYLHVEPLCLLFSDLLYTPKCRHVLPRPTQNVPTHLPPAPVDPRRGLRLLAITYSAFVILKNPPGQNQKSLSSIDLKIATLPWWFLKCLSLSKSSRVQRLLLASWLRHTSGILRCWHQHHEQVAAHGWKDWRTFGHCAEAAFWWDKHRNGEGGFKNESIATLIQSPASQLMGGGPWKCLLCIVMPLSQKSCQEQHNATAGSLHCFL